MGKMIIVAFTIGFIMVTCATVESRQEGISVLLLVSRNYGLNYFLMRDVFDQYGWNVVHTGVLDTITPCPAVYERLGIQPIIPDLLVSKITDITNYDCLVIPPGTGNYLVVPNAFGDIIESPEALDLISTAVQRQIPVFAMCAGVRVLAAADVVDGKRIVGSPRFREEYEAAGAIYEGNERNDTPPLIDGSIITSARGQTYNYANSMAIATLIENRQKTGKKKMSDGAHIVVKEIDFADEDITWAKTYGGPGSDGGRVLCETADGGYLIAGYTFPPGSSDADIVVLKTDANGDVVWAKTFGGAGTEYANGCTAVPAGYLITGYTTSFGNGSKDVYVISLDNDGNEVWSKTYGGQSWDVGTSVCAAAEGGYFVCGFTHSYTAGEEDIYLLKIDKDGNEIWSKTYGGERIEMSNSIALTSDGGCIIGATSLSYGGRNTDFYVMKTDADGNKLWAESYAAQGPAGHGFDWCKAFYATSDGGYVMTGYADCIDLMDGVVIKIDADGNEMWQKTFGNNPYYDYGNSICEMKDGSIVVAGITKSMRDASTKFQNIYDNDICLTKFDREGNITWQKTIGGHGSDWASSVVVTDEDEIFVLGHTDSDGNGSLDMCLLKVSSHEKSKQKSLNK
ncbi:MAG: DJ-1/PfpI family protein [candidate division WOR-3 bacterium]|nr:MAG: DJ-1/PfpI family protein [candidate division WOR-3 bacterium]